MSSNETPLVCFDLRPKHRVTGWAPEQCDTYNFIDLSSYRQCSRKRDWACYSSDEDDSDSSGSKTTSFKKKRTSGLVEYAPQAVGKMTPDDYPPESSDEITSDSCYDSTSDSGSDVSDEVWPPELNDDLIYHPMSQEERIISQIEDEEFLESYRTPTLYSRDAVWPDDVQPMLDECPMDEQEWLLCEEADREMERQEREAARANAMRNWE